MSRSSNIRPKLTKDGRALLRKALAVIKRRPETFDMGAWMVHDDSVKGVKPYCGTVACLAGHIVLAAGAPKIKGFVPIYRINELPARLRQRVRADRRWITISDLATDLVCADESSAHSLKNLFMSPGDYRRVAARVQKWLSGS